MKERLHILTILFKGCKAIYLICYANFIDADMTVLIIGFSCKKHGIFRTNIFTENYEITAYVKTFMLLKEYKK